MNRPKRDERGIETRFGGVDDDGEPLPGNQPTFYLHAKTGIYELKRFVGAGDDAAQTAEMAVIDNLIRSANSKST